jgi:hypothetical protein
MINKDDKGIFFSMEVILGLIPVFILLLTVANTNFYSTDSCLETKYFQIAQDTAELMSMYADHNEQTLFGEISQALSENPNQIDGITSARVICSPFMEKTLGKMKYRLVELNYLKGKEIISNGNFKNSKNMGVAVKSYGPYLFKLYVWQ